MRLASIAIRILCIQKEKSMIEYEKMQEGIFLSRPNRFLAHVRIDGREEICHVKNTGRCRELLIPGTSEPPDPAEPFVLSVSRSNGDEQFTGCRFISQQRQDTIRGVTQTRKGTAEKRTVMGIL